jgi:hypothetical protein
MKEFVFQPTLSLSKTKYMEFLLEHYHDMDSFFNIHLRWDRKTDLAGLRLTLSLWTFGMEITFFADKRLWDGINNTWQKDTERFFKASKSR